MNFIKTNFQDLYIAENVVFSDSRGVFFKPFSRELFESAGITCNLSEVYYSINNKNVVRGMHYQRPPYDHAKIVYVSQGSVLDVVLDIRSNSATYGQFHSIVLDATKGKYLIIPSGFAHGFLSLEDYTIINYAQTTCYAKDCDCGIRYDSFGFVWPSDSPILSDRDKSFVPFMEYAEVFI